MKNNIAIITVAYNRVDSIKRLLSSLNEAIYKDVNPTLIISIDKSETDLVERFADDYQWKHGEKIVRKHECNLGLRGHMLSLIEWFEKFDALVVLEDDITVSPYFFIFSMQCVDKYKNDNRIGGISLYNFLINYQNIIPFNPVRSEYDVYMMNCAMSWGQVWMKNQFLDFINWYKTHNDEFNILSLPPVINSWGKKSWLKYHTRYCIEENKYFIFPYTALSTNNGDEGTHNKKNNINFFHSNLQVVPIKTYNLPTFEDCMIKYDGFFEPKFLGKYVGVEDCDLAVDFYGNRMSLDGFKYVLTRKSLPYKILKSYALKYRPFEANVICSVEGDGLRLYDLNIREESKKGLDEISFYNYQYFNAFSRFFRVLGIKGIIKYIFENMYNKILRKYVG